MVRDFLKYLSDLRTKISTLLPVAANVLLLKKKFQRKAKKAYDLCLEAIEAEGQVGSNKKWKKIFGRPFPAAVSTLDKAQLAEASQTWDNTEQHIKEEYPIDIRYNLEIDCEVSQNGFREHSLRHMLLKHIPLLASKKLLFQISNIDVPSPYHIEWKVLNQGPIAERKNQIRGQIVRDSGSHRKEENTSFQGQHIVECYAIKNGVVVAKDRIDVPIKTGAQ